MPVYQGDWKQCYSNVLTKWSQTHWPGTVLWSFQTEQTACSVLPFILFSKYMIFLLLSLKLSFSFLAFSWWLRGLQVFLAPHTADALSDRDIARGKWAFFNIALNYMGTFFSFLKWEEIRGLRFKHCQYRSSLESQQWENCSTYTWNCVLVMFGGKHWVTRDGSWMTCARLLSALEIQRS